jgi:nucleoid-associated protein YgaU
LNLTLSYWVVQGGDSLSKIAQKEYGDMFLWPLIFDSNRQVIGSNPNIILPGQRLLIPDHTRLSPNQLAETERRGKTEWRR